MEEMGLRASAIAGTSMGAIVGAYCAAGVSARDMLGLIDRINVKNITRLVDLSLFRRTAFLKGKRIERFLSETIPADSFERLGIPLRIVASDFWRRREVVFDSGPLIPAVRASMSVPAVFEPVRVGASVLVDGGLVNPVPFDLLRNRCDFLIAIDVTGSRTPASNHPIPSMLESLVATFELMEASILENKRRACRPDLYVKPLLRDVNLFDFHRADEILVSVKDDVEQFKRDLEKGIRRKKRFWFF
jgi:NTE family protein